MGEFSMQDAMKQFLNHSRLKQGIQSVQIEKVWEEVMGKTIAQYTDKLEIKGHTLFITSKVAPLKNELLNVLILLFDLKITENRLTENFDQ